MVKKEVSQASLCLKEQREASKHQIEQCDLLQLKVQERLLKSASIGSKVDEQLKVSEPIFSLQDDSSLDEDELLLRAQRALSKSTAQRQLASKEEVAPSTVVFR